MNDFTASNGITIYVRDGGTVQFQHGTREESCGILQIFPHSEWWQALREFFQAEADERLGRWRWPDNPDYVVYDNEDGGVWVHSEREPGAIQYQSPGDVPHAWVSTEAGYVAASRAYFDAHPEPKPWHDAVEGEVWIIMFRESSHAWFVNGDYFQSTKTLTNIAKNDEGIIAARRIFPDGVAS